MKRVFLIPLMLTLALSACSSDDVIAALSPDLLQVAQCTGTSLEELDNLFSEVVGFLGAIGGTLPGNVTYDDVSGDYTIDSVAGPIAGIVSSTDDISDGVDPGESATATWDRNGGPAGVGGAIGTGTFNVSRPDADTIVVTGSGSLENGDCTFDVNSFNITVDLNAEGGPTGSIAFDATVNGETLDGTMSFDGSDIANVLGTFKGASASFRIDLNDFLPF
jgi:hypothetical protein